MFNALLKKYKLPSANGVSDNADATTHFIPNNIGEYAAIVCLFQHNFEIEQIHCLLVHEATHIFQKIKELIGESNPSMEFEAYSIQTISQNLIYEFKNQTKPKKKKSKNK
ncbi:MAG: hypothetical protein ACK41T_03675 [Pseudobdellovibrio sp.]